MALAASLAWAIPAARGADPAPANGGTSPPVPPTRMIPGLTAADPFPRGCVDCHVILPKVGMDVRISMLMKEWEAAVEPKLLDKAQACAPRGVLLKGRHPKAEASLRDIPGACQKCHGPRAKKAPSLARMMHAIHLTGGEANHFLTQFQGDCTHCHKFNGTAGEWFVPSGPEP